MKLLKNILFEILVIIYLTVVLSFVEKQRISTTCKGVAVEIDKDQPHDFVNQDEVIKTISNKGVKTKGVVLERINILKLEKAISYNPSIERCDVYRSINGVLCVIVKQRNPIVRIMNQMNMSYYIDEKGAMMPLSDRYTARVLIANGFILNPYKSRFYKDVTHFDLNDTINKSIIRDIFVMSDYIRKHEFLQSLIEQIYVTEDYEFVLTPRLGPHFIEFGTIEDYENKFKKLWILYKEALPLTGWDSYSDINLKYKNQVVCTKK